MGRNPARDHLRTAGSAPEQPLPIPTKEDV